MQHDINQCYECMRAIKESDSETRSVNPSQLGGRYSNPVVTTPMIALDFSGTTTQSASHNVALNQVVNQSVNQAQDVCFRNEEEYQQEEAYCAKKITKKISSYICPADGLTRLSSAAGLVHHYSADALCIDNQQSQDNQTQATAHPADESFNEPAVAIQPVAMMNQQRSS
ncbi:hypothetical protein F511_19742 [Dorcoceras hygrometricum]|uniref:Uncharacterized protein n=1 Tax=Dorcoceras hygrometricum TaxID=472368 RepID=A0A2Z7A653_9LAMI|nr:hypothetical protein F511_19742 [Dorcoceras hygrometricum]